MAYECDRHNGASHYFQVRTRSIRTAVPCPSQNLRRDGVGCVGLVPYLQSVFMRSLSCLLEAYWTLPHSVWASEASSARESLRQHEEKAIAGQLSLLQCGTPERFRTKITLI